MFNLYFNLQMKIIKKIKIFYHKNKNKYKGI